MEYVMNTLTRAAMATGFIAWAPHAMAYIDPGSGSAIMSAIIGAVVAVSMAVKTYWYKIKAIFTAKAPADVSNPDEES